jgi:hypothetical protein
MSVPLEPTIFKEGGMKREMDSCKSGWIVGPTIYTETIISTNGTQKVTGEPSYSEKEAKESAELAARVAGLK